MGRKGSVLFLQGGYRLQLKGECSVYVGVHFPLESRSAASSRLAMTCDLGRAKPWEILSLHRDALCPGQTPWTVLAGGCAG